MQKKIAKSVVLPSIMFPSLLAKDRKPDWRAKPADWSDIRKDCPADSIALYAGVKSDYSAYDNLGFTATCTGGYNVFIDGTQYGSTYASGTQCSITWSSLALTTGDDITTPSVLKAHKIWIEPATEGNNITEFRMVNREGLLWLHSNISTAFNSLYQFIGTTSGTSLIRAVTAKNNVLKSQQMGQAFGKCPYLEYLPVLDFDNSDKSIAYICYNPTSDALKKITIRNLKQVGNVNNSDAFNNNQGLKKIILKNSSLCWYQNTFRQNLYSLEELPQGLYNAPGSMEFKNASGLKPTDLDFRERTQATYIKVYGDVTHPMYGVKSLRVSNQAPFNDATAPQINVSYTGMDRQALVQLFNDLPYNVGYEVVGSPTITDGVATDLSYSNYCVSSQNITFKYDDHIKMKFKFKTPSSLSSNWANILSWSNSNAPVISLYSMGRLNIRPLFAYNKGNIEIVYNMDYDTDYVIELEGIAGVWTANLKQNDTIVATGILTTTEGDVDSIVYFGRKYRSTSPSIAELDFNNSYIEINDITWFNGKAAMTKTLSCVGATGTADLTQDDKDIALTKGWALTLS